MSKLHTESFVEWVAAPAAALNPQALKAGIPNNRYFITSVGVSFSVATTTLGTLTIAGATQNIVVQLPVGQLAPIFFSWTKAIRCGTGIDASATVAATGAGIQSVFITGYTVRE